MHTLKKQDHEKNFSFINFRWLGKSQRLNFNAILNASTPNLDKLYKESPHSLLDASADAVGLPYGQMGNSEVGHLNIGAGRIIYQDLSRVSNAINDGSFFTNPNLCEPLLKVKNRQGAVHIMGLLSDGGVHSHEEHLHAIGKLAKDSGVDSIYYHIFLDGRDAPPKSAMQNIIALENYLKTLGTAKVSSVIGRFYAMDRDQRWERVEAAYDLITINPRYTCVDAKTALNDGYARNETDEFISPTKIEGTPYIQDGDLLFFMNFRSDRARELTYALTDPNFNGFIRKVIPKIDIVTLTKYATDINATIAYPTLKINNTLGSILQENKKTQLRISETEKYAHVTFFFNGGIETPYPLETRILIPSPKVATYDLKPQMSAKELTDTLITNILSAEYDVIICNYPNGDMVGHTGNYEAALIACKTIDDCVGEIIDAITKIDGECLITADHGNAEMMFDYATNQPHTAHTCEQVPFIYKGPRKVKVKSGKLADIAPTILDLLNITKPAEMTGNSLIEFE